MNPGFVRVFRIGVLLLSLSPCLGVTAGDDLANDEEVQKTLKAMHNASTWFHPDLYGMTQGMQAYAKGDYAAAQKHFESGALYADKLSQLCLGLMYLNGEGVPKDIVRAYAWIDLASERKYPQFVATRNEVAKTMNVMQLERAAKLHSELAQRYGDVVAKPRMAVQLHQGLMNITGSHTGFDSGVVQISEVPCGPALIIGGRIVPQIGCGGMNEFLAKENWFPDKYFAARDREWLPQVSVGPLTNAGEAKVEKESATGVDGKEDRELGKH